MKNFKFLSLALLFTLISCGKEQFGSTPASESSSTSGVQVYENLSCAASTLVKPPVDIVYVVDNSTSTNYIQSNIKSAIQQTVNSVSTQFDYRIIGTPLISSDTNDLQVLASSPTSIPSAFSSKKIISSSEFNFFMNTVPTVQEQGFLRVKNFVNAHISSGLLRQQAHTIIILVSNGYDTDTTTTTGGAVIPQTSGSAFSSYKTSFFGFKAALTAKQVRFMSVVSHQSASSCSITANPGATYKEMSRLMYINSNASDNGSYNDSYDLCNNGFSSLFTGVNSSIQQVLQPHKYNRWPVTFTSGSLNTGDIEVYKVSGSTRTLLNSGSQWSLITNSSCGSPCNTRIEPTVGEPTSAPNIIEFNGTSNYITYPDCVVVKGRDYVEYFGYIVINREPDLTKSVAVTINGSQLSSADWTYVGYKGSASPGFNIKVPYNGSPDTPAVYRSGYMFQIKNNKYYKSGDSVEVYYQPAGI